MREYIFKDQNVDKAIQKGLKELRLKEEQVKIEVIEAGSSGLFGLFKKEAEVKLIPLDENYKKEDKKILPKVSAVSENKEKIKKEEHQEIQEIQEIKEEEKENNKKEDYIVKNKENILNYLEKIVHSMGFDTAVLNFEEEGNRNYTIKITEVENSSLLIGKRGATLNSLQYLVDNYAKRFSKYYYRINIDCDDYRENRKETLEELAINMAKKSKKLGKPIELEPMTAAERKIIHNALSDIKNVETESVGKEPHRYLVITAK